MICGAVGKGIGKYCITNKDVGQFVYRTSITIKGVTYYAKNYGKRAFRILVNKLK